MSPRLKKFPDSERSFEASPDSSYKNSEKLESENVKKIVNVKFKFNRSFELTTVRKTIKWGPFEKKQMFEADTKSPEFESIKKYFTITEVEV